MNGDQRAGRLARLLGILAVEVAIAGFAAAIFLIAAAVSFKTFTFVYQGF